MDVIVRQGASVRVAEKLAAQQLARLGKIFRASALLPPNQRSLRPSKGCRIFSLIAWQLASSSIMRRSAEPSRSSTTETTISTAFCGELGVDCGGVNEILSQGTLVRHSRRRRALINITEEVEKCLAESDVREGLCLVNAMHITASVFINDNEQRLACGL